MNLQLDRRPPRRAPGNREAGANGPALQSLPAVPAVRTKPAPGGKTRGIGHTTRIELVDLTTRRGSNGMKALGRLTAGAPPEGGAVTGLVATRGRARGKARGRAHGVTPWPRLPVRIALPRGATSPPDGLGRVLGPRLSRTGRTSHLRGGRAQGSSVKARRLLLASLLSRSSGFPRAGPNFGSSGGGSVRFPLLATEPILVHDEALAFIQEFSFEDLMREWQERTRRNPAPPEGGSRGTRRTRDSWEGERTGDGRTARPRR